MKRALRFTLSGIIAASVAAPVMAWDNFLNYTGVYVSATYTKPSNNGLSMGDMRTLKPMPTEDEFSRTLFLNPDFDWDFSVGGSYHIPETHTRFFLEYDQFTDNESRQAYGVRAAGWTPPAVGPTTSANAIVQEHMVEWRSGFRRFVALSDRFSMDLSGFIEYDKLSRSFREFMSGGQGPGEEINASGYLEVNGVMEGWGPGVGLKIIGLPFKRCPNLSLFAGVLTTLLYVDNKYNTYDFNSAASSRYQYYYEPESSNSIVGKYDVNFGFDYRRLLHVNGSKLKAGVTLGARYMNIANAFKNGNTYYEALPQLSSYPTSLGYPNDFGRVGPYLQFRLGGPHA